MKTEKIEFSSIEEFKRRDGSYIFPFEVLNKTPGGSNLWRIEANIEIVKGRKKKGMYRIEGIILWFSQTRDERYLWKNFFIPCWAEWISRNDKNGNFFAHVWYTWFCSEHGNIAFSAYPNNNFKELRIYTNSSIYATIDFQ